jgi:beta-lactam-binding protein with PASTA domain
MLRALVLLVVAMVSGLTAMRFAIHGREVAVPNLFARTMVEAHKLTEDSGLGLELERRYYSSEVLNGRILSQVPPAGTKVRRGWQVRVAESMGVQRIQIPSVVGQTQRAGEINIRRRGLELGTVAEMVIPDAPPDRIVSQSPPPNANGVAAPKISLLVTVAAGPQAFVMPNLANQPLGSVQAVLRAAGLRVGEVAEAGGDPAAIGVLPSSMVVSQSPAAGDKVLVGSAVSFRVK